jgi:hypothetical protein
MGTVIDFRVSHRLNRETSLRNEEELGTVIILPVVRVERSPDNPSDGIESGTRNPSGRKRRRRAARS